MPVFNAHIPGGRFSSEQKRGLADALNQSLVQALGVPEGDRFIMISEHDEDELFLHPTFMDIHRGPDAMIITVLVGAHRPLEDKRKVTAAINRLVVEAHSVSPDDIFIALIPVPNENFSFGRGELQLAEGAPRWCEWKHTSDALLTRVLKSRQQIWRQQMRKNGIHNYPATDRVVYGKPAAEALSDEVARLNAKRVFLIASRTLNTKTDEIDKIRRALGDRYAVTLDGIAQHTTRKQAANAALAARDAKADLIVAIGGGSAVDLAKIVIMAMEHDLRDEAGFDPYVADAKMNFRYGDTPFRPPSVRQIAIPSTLSGGEYNAAALVTDERTKLKQIFFHPQMMPVSIILDPALTLHAPTDLWMGSGTRAMDHGIEALCSPYGTPLADEVVLAGIRYLYDGMLKTLQDPADLEARQSSQYGSWLASFGLQARIPMGASHGIGHVLGGTCDVPHYYCTPVLMPSVLRYNMPFTENAQRRIASVLGATDGDASAAFARLVQKLGLPEKLSDVSVGEDKFALISRVAINHRFVRANPRPLEREEDIVELLRLAA